MWSTWVPRRLAILAEHMGLCKYRSASMLLNRVWTSDELENVGS